MAVKLVLRDKEYQVKAGMTLRHSLQNAGINPQSVLALRDGTMVTEEEILNDGDEVRLVAVISGGSVA